MQELANKYLTEYHEFDDANLLAASFACMEHISARTHAAFMEAFQHARETLHGTPRVQEWKQFMGCLSEVEFDDFLQALHLHNKEKQEQFQKESENYYAPCPPEEVVTWKDISLPEIV